MINNYYHDVYIFSLLQVALNRAKDCPTETTSHVKDVTYTLRAATLSCMVTDRVPKDLNGTTSRNSVASCHLRARNTRD